MTDKSSGEILDSALKNLKKFETDFKRLIGQLREIGGSQSLGVEETKKLKEVKAHLAAFQREISILLTLFQVYQRSAR